MHLAKRQKLKAPPPSVIMGPSVHDRRSSDLPINARVAVVEIDDPMPDPGISTPQKLTVLRSIRDDPLADMLSKDQLRDDADRRRDRETGGHSGEARYHAGRQWQKFYDMRQIGDIKAIDPSQDKVDGGRLKDPLSRQQMHASEELARAKTALGWAGNRLVEAVLGEGIHVTTYAMRIGQTTAREFDFQMRTLRQCLDTLEGVWAS